MAIAYGTDIQKGKNDFVLVNLCGWNLTGHNFTKDAIARTHSMGIPKTIRRDVPADYFCSASAASLVSAASLTSADCFAFLRERFFLEALVSFVETSSLPTS